MSLDERGRQAAEDLRAHVVEDLPKLEMLTSLQRTRGRRRLAMVVPVAAAVVAVVAVLTGSPAHEARGPANHPGPSAPTSAANAGPDSPARGNGVLFGVGDTYLRAPHGVYSPVLHDGSSPTWSPNGDKIAVLDGGILITEAITGAETRLPCPGCGEIAWAPDGGSFAAPGVGGSALGLVDAATGDVTPVRLDGVQAVRSVTWSPDSKQLAFLVTSPSSAQGAYTVNRNGSDLKMVVDYPTVFKDARDGLATMLAVRWAPTWGRLAVLFAEPVTSAGYGGQLGLSVLTFRSDGSGQNHLLDLGTCACVGFQPNLVWSPDGTTLAVYALHARADERRLDGDGREVQIRFLAGSGPLSWQPLPLVH